MRRKKGELIINMRDGGNDYYWCQFASPSEIKSVFPCSGATYHQQDKYGRWHVRKYRFPKRFMDELVEKGLVEETRSKDRYSGLWYYKWIRQ